MARAVDEAAGNYSLARKVYRNSVPNNGRLARPGEVPTGCDFHWLNQQFEHQK